MNNSTLKEEIAANLAEMNEMQSRGEHGIPTKVGDLLAKTIGLLGKLHDETDAALAALAAAKPAKKASEKKPAKKKK